MRLRVKNCQAQLIVAEGNLIKTCFNSYLWESAAKEYTTNSTMALFLNLCKLPSTILQISHCNQGGSWLK